MIFCTRIESKPSRSGFAPPGDVMHMANTSAGISLPMGASAYSPPVRPVIAYIDLEPGTRRDPSVLFSSIVLLDKVRLARHIRRTFCRTLPSHAARAVHFGP